MDRELEGCLCWAAYAQWNDVFNVHQRAAVQVQCAQMMYRYRRKDGHPHGFAPAAPQLRNSRTFLFCSVQTRKTKAQLRGWFVADFNCAMCAVSAMLRPKRARHQSKCGCTARGLSCCLLLFQRSYRRTAGSCFSR
jgi:hypothetical protein